MRTGRPSLPLSIAEAQWVESGSIHLRLVKVVKTQLLAFAAMSLISNAIKP